MIAAEPVHSMTESGYGFLTRLASLVLPAHVVTGYGQVLDSATQGAAKIRQQLTVRGKSHTVTGLVVLNKITICGVGHKVTLYIPEELEIPGERLSAWQVNNTITLHRLSWPELHKHYQTLTQR